MSNGVSIPLTALAVGGCVIGVVFLAGIAAVMYLLCALRRTNNHVKELERDTSAKGPGITQELANSETLPISTSLSLKHMAVSRKLTHDNVRTSTSATAVQVYIHFTFERYS